MGGGIVYTEDEFENFALSSESRKALFVQLHDTLETETVMNGVPFGRMPWSGALQGAYENTRTEILAMTDSCVEVMQVIADNIRKTRDHYQAAEVANTADIEKLGDD